jgi:glycosyltransferase involved in cell wall biosynthesis
LRLKISVITAVFNNRDTVAAALDSVLSQTHADTEVIIIDGGSTDGTLALLAGYANRVATLISERDGGIYHALNKGIALATGEVVGFLHSDDLMADASVLKRVVDAFADPDVDAVYGDLVYVRHSDPTHVVRAWKAGEFVPSQLAWGWMPPHPTVYVRREIYERLGGFDLSYRIAADYDCMLRFLAAGIRSVYIPHLMVRMRVGGVSNRSLGNLFLKSREDYAVLHKNGFEPIRALLGKNLRKLPQFWVK